MKRIFSLIFLACTYLIPIISQSNSHSKIDTTYGKSIAVVDARPFLVVNRAFKISIDHILNEKVLLVSGSSEKDMYFQYIFVRELDGNQSYDNKSRMTTIRYIPNLTQSYDTKHRITTIRYIPKNFHIQVPEIGSPILIKKL
jgi:hypothetical protein